MGPLNLAIKGDHIEIVKILTKVGAVTWYPDTARISNSPIFFAIRQGSLKSLEELCKYHRVYNVKNLEGLNPAHFAYAKGRHDAVGFLIKCMENLNMEDPQYLTLLMKYAVNDNDF